MLFRRFTSTSALPPTIRQLLSSSIDTPSRIQVNGWVKSIRRQKKVSFVVITDGSSPEGLQAVLSDSSMSKRLTNGMSVQLNGKLTQSPGPGQEKELQVESLGVLGECDPESYPIQKQALSVEYLREHTHLRSRTETGAAMLRFRDSTLRALHQFFENRGFCYAHTPVLTSSDCEGAGETFRVVPTKMPSLTVPAMSAEKEFFSRPSYLTVSSQLHLEALASAVSRVYTLSPCFRAERSQTNRHLAEFWMLEAEWAFTRSVYDVCGVVEDAIKTLIHRHSTDLTTLWKGGDEEKRKAIYSAAASTRDWTRMSYGMAITELERQQESSREFTFNPSWGKPLQSEHEKWLAEKLVGGPVFVTDYPASLKPFYMRLNDDESTVACFDLLVPHVGELVGGSLREERLPLLERSIVTHGLSKQDYGWYLDLRKYGGTTHGGFGLGFERLIAWLGGIENVRDCIPMPRWAGRMLL